MLYADGELDAAEAAALQRFLKAHPELDEQLGAWRNLKLEADTAVIFEAKDTLLKREPKRIALAWRPQVWAAAAAVAALVMLAVFQRDTLEQKIAIQHTFPATPHIATAQAVQVFEKPNPEKSEAAAKHKPVSPFSNALGAARESVIAPVAVASKSNESLAVPEVAPQMQLMSLTTKNEVPYEETVQESERRFPAIHIAAANQPAFNMLKQGLDMRATQISNAAKVVRETAFAVRIGNKAHYLNF